MWQSVKPPRGEKSSSYTTRIEIIQKLHAAGLQLTESLTTNGAQYLFRVSAPNDLLEETAESMRLHFSSQLYSSQEDIQAGLWPGFAPYVQENREKYQMYKLGASASDIAKRPYLTAPLLLGHFKPVERQTIMK